VTKGIYRFDPEIFDELWATPVSGESPTAVLERRPEWCVYAQHLTGSPGGDSRSLMTFL